jgi:hypothetical protein
MSYNWAHCQKFKNFPSFLPHWLLSEEKCAKFAPFLMNTKIYKSYLHVSAPPFSSRIGLPNPRKANDDDDDDDDVL